ncbi:MAG: peptidase [Deltaproteobacteria bacterium]|jgi:serine protease Do/serine protease DegQ|nr:peptidase [Deltaproteobacteria bacterium]
MRRAVYLLSAALAACAGCGPGSSTGPPEVATVQHTFVAAVERAVPAVVNIRTVTRFAKGSPGAGRRPDGQPPEYLLDLLEENGGFRENSLGSGVIVGEDGLIVTNEHVIRDADEIVVRLSDRSEYRAKVIGADVRTDLAVLRIQPSRKLPVATLGDSSRLKVGEFAIAVGNPFGLESTVTLGVISATGRSAEPDVEGGDDFIQTDASINPGNSGGPLLNARGEVVGINTAMVSAGQGIGFAIPINTVKMVEQELAAHGAVRRGWLGAGIQSLSPDLAEAFGAKGEKGILVNRVVPGSPAAKGGLRAGDILVAYGKTRLGGVTEFQKQVATTAPGTAVPLEIVREGRRVSVTVTVEEAEGQSESRRPPKREPVDPLGISVSAVPARLLREMELPGGVEVVFVETASPAWEGGIREGDILISLNREAVPGVDAYRKALSRLPRGMPATALIYRDGAHLYVAFRYRS